MKTYFKNLLKALENGKVQQITFTSGNYLGHRIFKQNDNFFSSCNELLNKKHLFENKTYRQIVEEKDYSYLYEDLNTSPTLVLFGAGHISFYLSKLATLLDLDYIVIDDRQDFCNKERFSNAKALISCDVKDFFTQLDSLNLGSNTYNVIATRGHKDDEYCLKQVLKRTNSYIGMIGSKTKVRQCMSNLEQEGFSKSLLDKVHSPIGLKIGSETPQEISISIISEIIMYSKQENKANIVDKQLIEKLISCDKAVLCQIVKQSGSSPRHLGSLMLVEKNLINGSVGGGAIEHRTIIDAKNMLDSNIFSKVNSYNLSKEDASDLGMICGGKATILQTII